MHSSAPPSAPALFVDKSVSGAVFGGIVSFLVFRRRLGREESEYDSQLFACFNSNE